MSYIWEYYSDNNEYVIDERPSPYFEILNPCENRVRVNTNLRFYEMIQPLLSYQVEEEKVCKNITDTLLHYLARLDFLKGMDERDVILIILKQEIMNCKFGRDVYLSYLCLDKEDQAILLQTLYEYYNSGQRENRFFEGIKRKYSEAALYYDNTAERHLLYLGAVPSEYNKILVCLYQDLFWDIQYELEVVWEKHFGLIGYEQTMLIGSIQIM
jgi:hypothetical protein